MKHGLEHVRQDMTADAVSDLLTFIYTDTAPNVKASDLLLQVGSAVIAGSSSTNITNWEVQRMVWFVVHPSDRGKND